VLDVGKTHVKLHVVDSALASRFSRSTANRVIDAQPYPHYDIEALWHWCCAALREASAAFEIERLVVTTHGATAALVDPEAGPSGLALPVMDYEFSAPGNEDSYAAVRPGFSDTFSPALPDGLNLGRQLFWQQRHCDEGWRRARYLLPYPQYWVWRLTGVACAEVTSWGCHTDLWAPRHGEYSTLVDALALRDKLPQRVDAGAVVGTLTESVAAQTGLSRGCEVVAGLHDSNASYLRYLSRGDAPFAVLSTGTWVICLASGAPLERLDEARDMLANVDIHGAPVASARFMGGREYAAICALLDSDPAATFTGADLQQLLDDEIFALPDFSGGSGPFGGRAGEVSGTCESGVALASLYCALLADHVLDLLQHNGDVIIEGAWLRNPLLCAVLAQLRQGQALWLSADETGTVTGAAQLALGIDEAGVALERVAPTSLRGLQAYRRAWRSRIADTQQPVD
jgi:sugar (pentulose or hexulose) kinase